MSVEPGRLHIEVADRDPRPPIGHAPPADGERGRGLVLVERIAAQWGWSPAEPSGKRVWCDLRAPAEGMPH
jgi:hypothetical protein